MSCLLLLVKFLSFEQENLNYIFFLTKQDGYKQSFWNRLLSQQSLSCFLLNFFYDNMGVAITVTVLHEQGQKDNIQA